MTFAIQFYVVVFRLASPALPFLSFFFVILLTLEREREEVWLRRKLQLACRARARIFFFGVLKSELVSYYYYYLIIFFRN